MLLLILIMSSEKNKFPVYIKFVEQKGEKTERLIEEIKTLSRRFNIYDEISLMAVLPSTSNSEENSLIYCIMANPAEHSYVSNQIIDFLEYVFQKMFEKYPAYTELV